jgi:hypothetical protein
MQRTTEAGAGARTCMRGVVIGLDLGDRWSRYCVLDEAGAVLEGIACAADRKRFASGSGLLLARGS